MADSIGFGVTLGWCATFGGSYTTLARLNDVGEFSRKRKMAKTTANDSANRYEECLPGLKEGGEVSVKFNYAKTQHAALITIFEAETQLYWKFTYGDGSTDIAYGHLSELTKTTPMEEREETSMKIQQSGKPVFTAAV